VAQWGSVCVWMVDRIVTSARGDRAESTAITHSLTRCSAAASTSTETQRHTDTQTEQKEQRRNNKSADG
jgi:hypothetical protein